MGTVLVHSVLCRQTAAKQIVMTVNSSHDYPVLIGHCRSVCFYFPLFTPCVCHLYGTIVCSDRQLFVWCLWICRLSCNYLVKAQFSEEIYDTKHLFWWSLHIFLEHFFFNQEYIKTDSLLQFLCTNPSTINRTLTNLGQFCYILEMMKMLKYCLPQLYSTWWWASEAETCSNWRVKT